MKRSKTLREQYGELLKAEGKSLEDCKVVAFRFSERQYAEAYHFAVMGEIKGKYLFDVRESTAIVIAMDKDMVPRLRELAELYNGTEFNININL